MGGSLGIVVPAFDPDVERLAEYVEELRELDPATIRIELDDPTGRTRERLRDLPATVAVADRRRGKGAAITAGFEALGTDVRLFVDADGSTNVESLRRVLEPVSSGEAALAVGSRRHPDASVANSQSRLRGNLGDGFAWLARRLLPVALYDYQCGAKAIDADAWRTVRHDLYEPGFGWDVNLVAAAGYRGLEVAEVPIQWADHPASTVDPLRTSITLGRALVRTRRRRYLTRADATPLPERLADHD